MVLEKLATYFGRKPKPEEKKIYLHVGGQQTTWRAVAEFIRPGEKGSWIALRRDEDDQPMDLPYGTYAVYSKDGTRVNYVGDEEFGSWILMVRPYEPRQSALGRMSSYISKNFC